MTQFAYQNVLIFNLVKLYNRFRYLSVDFRFNHVSCFECDQHLRFTSKCVRCTSL